MYVGGEERSPTNNKGGGHPTAQTFLTPMNMQHIDIFDNVFQPVGFEQNDIKFSIDISGVMI